MHDLSGNCPSCEILFDRYPNCSPDLKAWFQSVQKNHPEAHVDVVGRGREAQELAFQTHASDAHYGESSHSYNAACDIFQLTDGKAVWEDAWYLRVIAPNIIPGLCWFGAPGSIFKEAGHVEILNWKSLAQQGKMSLVEP